MEGGGKLAYSHGGAGGLHRTDTPLRKSFSGVDPRKFGLALVAGLLLILVTRAYFSTGKFDAVHIAMGKHPVNPHRHANAGDSSKQTSSDLGLQDQQGAWSKEWNKDEVLDEKDGDGGGVSSFGQGESGKHPSSSEGGGKDEVPEKDDDASAVAGLPPMSSDSSDSTQESGVLEDQELQVQNAIIAAAANPPKESNSTSSNDNGSSGSVNTPDPAEIPVPSPTPKIEAPSVQQNFAAAVVPPPTPEIEGPSVQQNIAAAVVPPPTPEIEAPSVQQNFAAASEVNKPPPVQLIPSTPEVKQTGWEAPLREWKPLCDVTSNYRIDWCVLDGDVRVLGSNTSVTLVAPPGADERTFREESWSIKPYPRKADLNAMRGVRALTVRSSAGADAAPACTDWHDVPALVFSDRGYTGNYFHAYTDVILPLFLTARQYSGEVLLLVADFQMWWWGKFLPAFKALSKYEPIDLDKDPRVHCFRHVQVGLTSHDDFSIDPRRAPNGYAMPDFTQFMRAAYGLPRHAVPSASEQKQGQAGRRRWRPRLLVIARARTRRFLNTEEIARGARRVGFEVVVSEGTHEVAPFAELVNSCDAVVGVHGAGLTNMVFLPRGGVVIQVLPLGPLEFVANYFRGPAADMGLRYLEYRVSPEESTLVDQYPRDHPVLTNPESVRTGDWAAFMGVYLFKQDVRLDMKRFRPVLKKAIAGLRANKPKNN